MYSEFLLCLIDSQEKLPVVFLFWKSSVQDKDNKVVAFCIITTIGFRKNKKNVLDIFLASTAEVNAMNYSNAVFSLILTKQRR